MAVCYNCGTVFYGYYCHECDWEARYICWCCKSEIYPAESSKCKSCGWFICENCYECGCAEERPDSNEEKIGERERDI